MICTRLLLIVCSCFGHEVSSSERSSTGDAMSSPLKESNVPQNLTSVLRSALKRDSSKPGSPAPVDFNSPDISLSHSTSTESRQPTSDASPPPLTSGVGMLHPMTSSSFNPPGYTTKVSFDTFNSENNTPGDAAMFSYTLQVRN